MESNPSEESTASPHLLLSNSVLSTQLVTLTSFSLAVLCLTLFVIITRRKSSSRGNALLLVGPPAAGKTAILSTLVYNQALPSHTSLQTNSSLFALHSKPIRVLDVPGHPRVRDQFLEHLSDAKVIAFVVDSSTVSRNGAAVAEHLHHILHAVTSLPPSQRPPELLILAHKCDLLSAATSLSSANLAINRVKTILERELEKRRVSQSGGVGVDGLGAEGERSDMGGLECTGNSSFRFEDWEGGDVVFIGTFVHVGEKIEKGPDVDGMEVFREQLYTLL